jgi:hypothetical protein
MREQWMNRFYGASGTQTERLNRLQDSDVGQGGGTGKADTDEQCARLAFVLV